MTTMICECGTTWSEGPTRDIKKGVCRHCLRAELETWQDGCSCTDKTKADNRATRSDWERAHDLLDAHGVPTTPPGQCGHHLVERLEAVLRVWDAIGLHSGQYCEDLKYLCNTTPEVTAAIRAYRAAFRG